MVYIEEAHASDVWQMSINVKEKVVFATPNSYEERTAVANTCVKDLGIEFPALIDDFSNSVEKAYTGWPDRLYVVDRDGRIASKSKPGPYGFRPDDVAVTLERLVPLP